VSIQLHTSADLYPGKNLPVTTEEDASWVSPRTGLDDLERYHSPPGNRTTVPRLSSL
jgi:hypothetical protein